MKTIGNVLLSLAVLGMAAQPAATADSGDWPIWSGPNHDLTSLGNGAFDDPTFGLEVLWSKPLGSGYSGI
ncbi:MAG: hypothetical protein GY856_09600, partial [bacterium]|nr:hypothetical protein [bacterium]